MSARLFVRPGFKSRLAFCRLSIPAPLQLTCLRIVRFQKSRIVQRIAANSGPALRMTKQLLRQAQTARLDETLQLSAALQGLAHHSAEHDAAVAAFFAHRR